MPTFLSLSSPHTRSPSPFNQLDNQSKKCVASELPWNPMIGRSCLIQFSEPMSLPQSPTYVYTVHCTLQQPPSDRRITNQKTEGDRWVPKSLGESSMPVFIFSYCYLYLSFPLSVTHTHTYQHSPFIVFWIGSWWIISNCIDEGWHRDPRVLQSTGLAINRPCNQPALQSTGLAIDRPWNWLALQSQNQLEQPL